MYPLKLHPSLTVEKWALFPLDRQILMIGNELRRFTNGLSAGQSDSILRETLERAFELIDLTVELARPAVRHELLRFREHLGELYVDANVRTGVRFSPEVFYRVLLQFTRNSARLLGDPTPTPFGP